jgi:hypothetical protein
VNWSEARELAEMAIADREDSGLQLVDRVANAILAAANSTPDGGIPIRVDPRLRDDEWELRPRPPSPMFPSLARRRR